MIIDAFMAPTIDMEATGNHIRVLRKERGLSVREVADAMMFNNPTAVYRWESAITLPSLDNLCVLAWLFKVKVDDILVYM